MVSPWPLAMSLASDSRLAWMKALALAEPPPGSDYMTNMQWCAETNIYAMEALAEILGIELEAVQKVGIGALNDFRCLLRRIKPHGRYYLDAVMRPRGCVVGVELYREFVIALQECFVRRKVAGPGPLEIVDAANAELDAKSACDRCSNLFLNREYILVVAVKRLRP